MPSLDLSGKELDQLLAAIVCATIALGVASVGVGVATARPAVSTSVGADPSSHPTTLFRALVRDLR